MSKQDDSKKLQKTANDAAELAGLGVLAIPSLDHLQATARARLAKDQSHEGVEKRRFLGDTAGHLMEVGGLGILAAPYITKRFGGGAAAAAAPAGRALLKPPHMLGPGPMSQAIETAASTIKHAGLSLLENTALLGAGVGGGLGATVGALRASPGQRVRGALLGGGIGGAAGTLGGSALALAAADMMAGTPRATALARGLRDAPGAVLETVADRVKLGNTLVELFKEADGSLLQQVGKNKLPTLSAEAPQEKFRVKTGGSKLREQFQLTPMTLGRGPEGAHIRWKASVGGTRVGEMHTIGRQVSVSRLDPKFQGMGLGRKMYGEVMRRMPDQQLSSDSALSDPGKRLWESFKNRGDVKVTMPPVNPSRRETGFLGHTPTVFNVAPHPHYTGVLPGEAAVETGKKILPTRGDIFKHRAGQVAAVGALLGLGALATADMWGPHAVKAWKKHKMKDSDTEKAAMAAPVVGNPAKKLEESQQIGIPKMETTTVKPLNIKVAQEKLALGIPGYIAGQTALGLGMTGGLLGAGVGAVRGYRHAGPDESKLRSTLVGGLKGGAVGAAGGAALGGLSGAHVGQTLLDAAEAGDPVSQHVAARMQNLINGRNIRVKVAFTESQYSGGTGEAPFNNYASYIPPFRKPQIVKPQNAEKRAMLDELAKLNSVSSPQSQISSSQSVGAPRTTAPPGPSIQQVSKPKGFGRALPGAIKGV